MLKLIVTFRDNTQEHLNVNKEMWENVRLQMNAPDNHVICIHTTGGDEVCYLNGDLRSLAVVQNG